MEAETEVLQTEDGWPSSELEGAGSVTGFRESVALGTPGFQVPKL